MLDPQLGSGEHTPYSMRQCHERLSEDWLPVRDCLGKILYGSTRTTAAKVIVRITLSERKNTYCWVIDRGVHETIVG
jgi:hypothetical protein